MFEEYEGAPGAVELQLELMNPISQLEIVTDPSLENLIRAAYMPGIGIAGYALVAVITGEAAPGFWVRRVVGYQNTKATVQVAGRFAYAALPVVVITGSAVAQREVWQGIGDQQTGAVHFAAAGTMSGGSMPVVSGSNSPYQFSSPSYTLEDLWNDIF
jgi:hypothetical protein